MIAGRYSTGLASLLVGLSLTLLQPASADAQTIDDTGLWLAAFGNGEFETIDVASELRWWFDAHYRLRDDTNGFNQSIIRPGIGYALNKEHAVWAGYAWINTDSLSGNNFDEHRLWQQWTYAPSVDNWFFLHRSRFEQRWLETGSDVGLRWRQLARAQRVLTRCPQWSAVVWDEIFFHLNDTDWGAESGLDQNRAFIGVGFKHTPESRTRTEVGYLNQFINRQGAVDGMNHILSVNIFF